MKRVRLVGATSTGKTTLATMLASAYGTVFVPEFGRSYGEMKDRLGEPWTSEEFTYIAQAQNATEIVAEGWAKDLLFCDTDALTTAIFHEAYLGLESTRVRDIIRTYDLTFLMGIDFPFVPDGVRKEATRGWFEDRLLEELRHQPNDFVWLRGSLEKRLSHAKAVIEGKFGVLA